MLFKGFPQLLIWLEINTKTPKSSTSTCIKLWLIFTIKYMHCSYMGLVILDLSFVVCLVFCSATLSSPQNERITLPNMLVSLTKWTPLFSCSQHYCTWNISDIMYIRKAADLTHNGACVEEITVVFASYQNSWKFQMLPTICYRIYAVRFSLTDSSWLIWLAVFMSCKHS